MPTCPNENCKKEIKTLREIGPAWVLTIIGLDKEGDPEPQSETTFYDSFNDKSASTTYECPECGWVIAENYEDATDFLKTGEIIPR